MKYKYIGKSKYWDGDEQVVPGQIVNEMLMRSKLYEKVESKNIKKIKEVNE